MSLEIHSEKLDSFAAQLGDLAGQVDTAKEYLSKHLELSWHDKGAAGQFIWAAAVSKIGEVRDAVNANLDKLKVLTTGSSGELTKSAKMYRETDRAHAEKLDNTY